MDAIHVETVGRIGCQSCIIVGFFNQILRSGPLTVEPGQESNRAFHVGHENPVFARGRIEQLILFSFLGIGGFLVLLLVVLFLVVLFLVVLFLPRRFVV